MRRCLWPQPKHAYFVAAMQLRAFRLRTKVLAECDVIALTAESGQRLQRLRTSEGALSLVYGRNHASFARFYGAQQGIADRNALPEIFSKRYCPRDHQVSDGSVLRVMPG